MAFKFQHGDVIQAVELGRAAGAGERRRRKEAEALRFAEQLQNQRNAIRMAELRIEAQFQRDVRSQEFELEKVNIQNQNNFMMREKLRMDKIQLEAIKEEKRQAGLEMMIQATEEQRDAGFLSEAEAGRHILNLRAKHEMGPSGPTIGLAEMTPIQEAREGREAGRYEMAQERHEAAMIEEPPSFAERTAARKFLEEEKRPAWKRMAGWGSYAPEMGAMVAEAERIVGSQPDEQGRIRVRDKKTGQTGSLPTQEFDPNLYERI